MLNDKNEFVNTCDFTCAYCLYSGAYDSEQCSALCSGQNLLCSSCLACIQIFNYIPVFQCALLGIVCLCVDELVMMF